MPAHASPSSVSALAIPDLRTIAAAAGARRAPTGSSCAPRSTPASTISLADPRVIDLRRPLRNARSFDDVYAAIVERVLAAARRAATSSSRFPATRRSASGPVRLLARARRRRGIPVGVLPAVSASGCDRRRRRRSIRSPTRSRSSTRIELRAIARRRAIRRRHAWTSIPTRPLLVAQVYNRDLAIARQARARRDSIPDDHEVPVVDGRRRRGERAVVTLPAPRARSPARSIT